MYSMNDGFLYLVIVIATRRNAGANDSTYVILLCGSLNPNDQQRVPKSHGSELGDRPSLATTPYP